MAAREDLDFPARVGRWLSEHSDLVDALVHLRRAGDEASDALDVALGIRSINLLRCSYELWTDLCVGDDATAQRLSG